MDLHHPVFFASAGLILLFVIGTLMFPGGANSMLTGARGWTIQDFDWLFIWAGNLLVVFCVALIFLPVGRIRLGGEQARPEFSIISWFAM